MNKILLFLVFIGIVACNPTVGKERKKEIFFSKQETQSDLYDLLQNKRYITLETTDESLFSDITQFLCSSKELFIFDIQTQSIYVFDYDGKFLRKLNKKGQGPGEYTSIRGIEARDGSDYVYIFSRERVLVFQPDGTFVCQFPKPGGWATLMMKDSLCLSFIINHTGQQKDRLLITDTKADTIYRFPQYDRFDVPGKFNWIYQHHYEYYLYTYQGEHIFRDYYSDTIYTVKHNELVPRFRLDMGRYALPKDLRMETVMMSVDRNSALAKAKGANITEIADIIKKTAFKVTRMGQLVAQEASRRLGIPFGIIDLSLAPTPAIGDSVADILCEIGLEKAGAPGTTAALAMLNDQVKKGGVMASSYVGGLSGAFIPVSEDQGMIVESIPGRDEWNAIDANMIVDENGVGWLSFGSFWRGIKIFRLDETMTRMAEPQEWYPICRRPEGTTKDIAGKDDGIPLDPRGTDYDPGNGAVEAPFIFRHGGYYYLFVSYDLCCRGEKSTYNVVVGRSEKVTGPYLDKNGVSLMNGGGTVVAAGNGRYAGMGHCAVVRFGDKDYMFMHGYDSEHEYRSKLMVEEIEWTSDGWPVIKLEE